MWPNLQKSADLVIFTEEILNGKLHFLCSNEALTDQKYLTPLNFEGSAFLTKKLERDLIMS